MPANFPARTGKKLEKPLPAAIELDLVPQEKGSSLQSKFLPLDRMPRPHQDCGKPCAGSAI